jgi:hypothetical protein
MPLKIEAHENCITLHAPMGAVRWLFLAFGFGVPLLMWWLGHVRLDGSSEFGLYFVGLFFVATGFLLGLQPTIQTTFDFNKRVICIRRQFVFISRQTVVPFSAVKGLGLREYVTEDGAGYVPELRTLDGASYILSRRNSSYFRADALLEQIRQGTGLHRLDRPARL